MKYLIFFIVSLPSFAALNPSVVKESALKFHPTVLAAMEKYKADQETVNGAKGAFDAVIVSDYKAQTKQASKMEISRTQIEKPLRIANSRVYVGHEYIKPTVAGALSPIYNTGNPTAQQGGYKVVGAKISLWKNLNIDPDRANLKNAKFDAMISDGEKELTKLDIGRLAQLAYWEWVTAKKVKSVYEELLKNGETRNDYLVTRSKKGDTAQIIVTENEQYVASRKGALQSATERLILAEYALSLFYRDESGKPILPISTDSFEDYPEDLSNFLKDLNLQSDIDKLMEKRPDLKNLSLTIEKSKVDLDLAKQDLRPQIDLTSEYYQRTSENPNMPRDYLMVMGQVSIPIERNLGNGNVAAARARQMVAEKEMSLGQQSYRYQVMALRQSLGLRLEQVKQSEIEVTKAKKLVESEAYKFKTGGGNLFLVNLREEAKASAEASFHDTRLAFMEILLNYKALVSTGE